jgi:phage terminase large subunit
MSSLSKDQIQAILKQRVTWAEHGDQFVRDMFAEELQPYQVQIFDSVHKNIRTAVKSCHDSGKSYTASRLAGQYLATHPESIVLTTAPTFRQVENVIWREIRGMYHKAIRPLGGDEPLKTRWEYSPNWYAIGISSRDSNAIQGFHSKSGDILIIVDEGAGVSEEVFEGIEALLTSGHARLLVIGNPTSLSGKFFRMFKDPTVHKISISCFDTGNFVANGIKTIEDLEKFDFENMVLPFPYLLNPSWAHHKLFDWGKDSPMFQSRVLGEFPEQDKNTLIPLNWLDAASTEERRELTQKGAAAYGHDIARYGDDNSPILKRYGDFIDSINVFKQEDTMMTAGRAVDALRDELGQYYIDITGGLGSGPYDRLVELNYPTVFGLNMSSKATDPATFINLRAELAWIVREKFRLGEIYIPDDDDLKAELSNIHYKIASDGRRQIEAKEEIKKRLHGRSPDRADALFMSFANPEMGENGANKQQVGSHSIWSS